MSELSYQKLTEEGIARELETLSGWQVIERALSKEFSFENYTSGVVFAVAVAHVADTLNHHPDMMVGYGKVKISMVTHDAGGGLTAYDFELARRIDRLNI